MADAEDTGKSPRTRLWKDHERAKVSLFQVFRDANERHDAKVGRPANEGGETEISVRSKLRRDGIPRDKLRTHLQADLNALLNTVRLDATVSLEDAPHVARSVLNYGFRDLSNIAASELNTPQITASIRQSLIDHEPRLLPESIEVRITRNDGGTAQRISLSVSAELIGDPVDIPVDFDAEVDLGAGKLRMSKLRVQT
ncbi:MAG: type VI secretion system baseplate subunit TssE [Roseovarius sp.]|uniref:type VI secretion system baseplate subunit TssE n=1 Tax=Roseovarius sp. TaxID=1486281 RepID=UPI0032EBA0ED